MFNTYLYNTALYNTNGEFAVTAPSENIEFEGFGLQNANIVISDLFYQSMPRRSIDARNIPRGDGETILSDFFRRNRITMRGTVKDTTGALLDARLDTIKKNLNAREGSLKITDEAGTVKEYIATLVNTDSMLAQKRGFNISWTPIELVFEAYDPFGRSLTYNLEEIFDETSLAFNGILDNVGTYITKPDIILLFTAADTVTKINFKNNTNDDEIEITTALVATDVLEINSEEQFVRKNGVDLDYDGVFPEFGTGESSYTLTVTGTSATWTMTIKHKTTYL